MKTLKEKKEYINQTMEQLDAILIKEKNKFLLNTDEFGVVSLDIDCKTYEEVYNWLSTIDKNFLNTKLEQLRDYNHFNKIGGN